MTQPDEDLLTLDERLDPDIRDIEAPTTDAFEQAQPAYPTDAPPTQPHVPRTPVFEANEYDVIEQQTIVELDDDYR